MADNSRDSGYHTPAGNPSGKQEAGEADARRYTEARLLKTALKEVKEQDLEGAVATLHALVQLAPEEPGYAHLLRLARRNLEREGWYRFQAKYGDTGVSAQPSSPHARPEQLKQPALPPKAMPVSLDELLLLRLKLSTWLGSGVVPPDGLPGSGRH